MHILNDKTTDVKAATARQGEPCDGLPLTPVDRERGRAACATSRDDRGRGVDEARVRINRSGEVPSDRR